jgi:hypothetical protein
LPPRKKSITTFKSQVIDSKEDEERNYLNEMGGEGGEKLQTIAIHNNLEEEPKPNLDQVIDNIQVELVEPIQPMVSIIEPKQPIIIVVESS